MSYPFPTSPTSVAENDYWADGTGPGRYPPSPVLYRDETRHQDVPTEESIPTSPYREKAGEKITSNRICDQNGNKNISTILIRIERKLGELLELIENELERESEGSFTEC